MGSRFKVSLTNATNSGEVFWRQVRGEILALNVFSAGLAFSAVTLAVSEPSLLPAAENWSPGWRSILAP